MAELTTLARPYAKAAFEYARDKGQLTEWSKMLETLAAVAGDERIARKLNDPALTAAQQSGLLLELLGDAADAALGNFLSNLASNKRLGLLADIAVLYEQFKAQLERSVDVEVISAQPMSDEQTSSLTAALTRHLEREVSLQARVDPTLIGGAVVRAGDAVIDGTVRGRLNRLAEATNS